MPKYIEDNLTHEQLTKVLNGFKQSIQYIDCFNSAELKYYMVLNLLKILSWGTVKQFSVSAKEIMALYNKTFDDVSLKWNYYRNSYKAYEHKTNNLWQKETN